MGPVEVERYGRDLASIAPALVDEELVTASAVIAAADAYVGNDAGMTHVAAATGVPTVALFGPTNPIVWRPLGDHVTVLTGRTPGTFDGVTVRRVHHTVLRSLQGASGP